MIDPVREGLVLLLRAAGTREALAILSAIESAHASEPKAFTDAELMAEIESGPLAKVLAPFWATVFERPKEQRPEDVAAASVHDVKVLRAGRLMPDAAFEIHRLLTSGERSRCEELGWGNGWSWKRICDAKEVK